MRYLSTIFIFCMLFVAMDSCVSQTKAPDLITVESLDRGVVNAILKDDEDFIKKSVNEGLKVNVRDKDGSTYLHRAAFCGAKKAMEALLEAGAPVDAADIDGVTALNFICTLTPSLARMRDSSPSSALQLLPKVEPKTAIAMIELLLKYHADPNIASDKIGAPLHSIAGHGTPALCEMLLNGGANINLYLIEHDTPLFAAVIYRNIDNIRFLISKGADLNLGHKCSPIYYAALKDDLEIGKMLIDAGADVNSKSIVGTALTCVRKYGYVEFEKMLLDHGAHE